MNIKSVSTIVLSSAMILGFCQCKQQNATNDDAQQEAAPVAVSGLKIAVVDVDSLLANYAFYQDLAEEIFRKQENYSLVLTEEKNKIEQDIKDFNRKVEMQVFSSAERQNAEYNRIGRRQQSLEEKAQKYSQELENESAANSQKIGEAVDTYIKKYNKTHGYNLIVNKAGTLFSDQALDITAEILDGLNAEYNQLDK